MKRTFGTDIDSGSDASPRTVGELFVETMGLVHMMADGDWFSIINDSGLTMPQLITLHVLRSRGPCTVGDIADAIRLSRPATSHLVDRLVSKKYVHRAEDPEDRRQKRVTVSQAGIDLETRVFTSRLAGVSRALDLLTPETRERFAGVLRTVIGEIKERAGDRLSMACGDAGCKGEEPR